MAIMYSKLGGCFGETAKLGPLARTDLCALLKGLLDRLMTHFGLGSSMEEPWGLFCLLGRREALASWGQALLVTWEALAWEEPHWEASLSDWEIVLSARGVLPAWELPTWELLFWEACKTLSLAEHLTPRVVRGLPAWGTLLSAQERALSAGKAWGLPAWETVLSAWERALSAGQDWGLPVWETLLSAWEGACLPVNLMPSEERP